MKKLIVIFICCLTPLISACDFLNEPYRRRMLEYYSDDSNYVILTGSIVEITYDCVLEIEILTEDHNFPTYGSSSMSFQLYTSKASDYGLDIGDIITFTSAPWIFYNGHNLPIVSLSRGEEQFFTFETGKKEYLKWIEEEF
ncbi:MAG: hypothetical protein HFK06_00360 [Clostridia bacterium]|nr:hypothetical protein [Clostridia bacterium]